MTTIDLPGTIAPVKRPDGTPSDAESLAGVLLSNAARINEFAEEAAALASPNYLWLGEAASAYSEHAAAFAKKHEPMAATLKRVARGIDVFAEQLRTLLSEHTDLTGEISAYHRDRNDLIADVNAAVDVTEAAMAELQDRTRSLATRHAGLVDEIARFTQRVSANEDFLVQLFTGADTVSEAASADGGIAPLALSAIGGMPSVSDGPEKMAQWWAGLSEAEQDALIAAYPERLGSADGLPARVRDDANRLLLDSELAELRRKDEAGTLTSDERQRLENAEAAAEALKLADDYVVPGTDEKPGGTLWLYDPDAFDGDGRVAIAVGDLDTADDVSIQIPGIRTEMDDSPAYAQQAADLYESARYSGDGSSVATMFWLGYDTPAGDPLEWGEVPLERYAADGGERLADAVDGLRASRADNPAHMTAIGHSYGSTTTAYAATEHGLAVDDIALVGSPGTGPAESASDFSVGADHVYVGRNSSDVVAALGDEGWLGKDWLFDAGLGVDPSSEDFGAHRFEAEAVDRHRNVAVVRGHHYESPSYNIDDHIKYFDRDTESLYNLGRIVDGHGGDVNAAEQSYDPWWDLAQDPEANRTPTSDEDGQSNTGLNP
ncbi:alpha/beta hydrolase [Microbacterium sp.]|uniref:alpha/beta hydrolase n=1 Tax=Microbacterium sp. TaxID=51671 RepID=UPI0039E3AC51